MFEYTEDTFCVVVSLVYFLNVKLKHIPSPDVSAQYENVRGNPVYQHHAPCGAANPRLNTITTSNKWLLKGQVQYFTLKSLFKDRF